MLRRVRSIYENRHYQRQWIRMIRLLGDKWLLAQYQRRVTPAFNSEK
jgi:hypothetical protein